MLICYLGWYLANAYNPNNVAEIFDEQDLSSFLSFFLSLVLPTAVSCKTIDVWNEGYPKTAAELSTEQQKKEEFNKFAIYKGNASHSEDGYVQLQKDKESDKYYSLGSFSSVITSVSPDTKVEFQQLNSTRKYMMVAVGALIGGVLLNSDSNKNARTASNALYTIGLGGMLGIGMWQNSIFSDIKSDYHKDLNQRIYGHESTSQSRPRQQNMFGLNFTYNLSP